MIDDVTSCALQDGISLISWKAGAHGQVINWPAFGIDATGISDNARVFTEVVKASLVIGTILVLTTFGSRSCCRRKRRRRN